MSRPLAALLLVALALPSAVAAAAGGVIPIPFEKFVLDNGLTLIVHEDHKAPVVAVNVWYDVGSGDEPAGKTGFAHLFEHLMFNGSANFDDDYMKGLDRLGATGTNGTTNFDRTNYFQVVPKTALDGALWLESDRMGHMKEAVDQAKLDEQRGVVQNEKRQGENQPYGKSFLTIFEHTYPAGHPYAHSVIGSMDDLEAASLEDTHEWFQRFYGPNNAVLVVAGDVEPADVRARVEKYFGWIPPGPPIVKPDLDLARRSAESRWVLEDRVPQARLHLIWNGPAWGMDDVDYLTVAGDVLSTGKSSRLYKRLVYEDQIATDVEAFAYPRELGGLFGIVATAQPGMGLAALEAAIREELAEFRRRGPTADELARSKTGQRAEFLRGLENVGGFGGKSDVLAASEIYLGRPDAHEEGQARVLGAAAEQVRSAAERWLDDGVFVLEVVPFREGKAAAEAVDRSAGLPVPVEFPAGEFPRFERVRLANGLEVLLARRPSLPLVELALVVDAGFAADQFASPGTANLAMEMLDEGTQRRDALQISDETARLGMDLLTASTLDTSVVRASVLTSSLDASLDLFADVALHPAFPEKEFERLKKLQLAEIQSERTRPFAMAARVFPKLIYGAGHAYAIPFSGSGTIESVSALALADLRAFHRTWFKPNNARLLVVGDVSASELVPKLERAFAGWRAGETPRKSLPEVELAPAAAVYLLDRPGSEQSMIVAGHVVPAKRDPADLAIDSLNALLGGSFTARLNMNLREGKHWSYGSYSQLLDAAAQRPWFAYAPVQTDKTAEAMAEIQRELAGLRGAAPPTAAELAKIQDKKTLTLPGRWQTNGAVLNDLSELVRFGLPDDHWDTFAARVRALALPDLEAQAARVLQPARLVWVVVGDRQKIEPGIRALGLGELHFLDPDGNPAE